MIVVDLILNVKEHRLLKKYKNSLEKLYGVSICVPNVDKSCPQNDVIFGSINGIQQSIESVKRFLSNRQKKSKSSEWKYPDGIILVTLSDSEDESSELDDTNCVVNSANCTESAIVPLSNPLDESVCMIESTVDPENSQNEMNSVNSIVDPEISQNEVNSIVSPSDSILIIDSPCSEKTPDICRDTASKKQKLQNEMNSVVSPSDSILIIDSPCSEKTPEFCRSASNKMQKNFDTKKRKNKNLKQCDEFENSSATPMMKKAEPAPDFITLYNDNSRKGSSRKRKLSPVTVTKDIIVLDNSKIKKSMPVAPCQLRPIVIDGSNVAREHGRVNCVFSSKGIKLCVDYFLNRGHTDITVFLPPSRKHADRRKFCPTTDQQILEELNIKHVKYTPGRKVNGQYISCYDDRFVVQLAVRNGGVIVSNDNFRDLQAESDSFKKVIEQRLLMYCFVGDEFMVPDDPLGRNGPRLNEYLSFPPKEKE